MPDRPARLDPESLPDPVDVSDNTEALRAVQAVVDAGPFDATWESLAAYEPPRWYEDAKFGVFLHWGVYSVPAFGNEWYSREMYREGTAAYEHHVATYGPQRDFGYKDFIPSFTMEQFDPTAWAALFRRAGAQFVVPVAEHHDGFAMYDTARSRWSAAQMGPRRDVFGDLSRAVDDAWMVRGASSHRAEHWFFMNGGARFDSDVLDPRWNDFYGPAQREETAPNERFLEDWLLRTVEVIDRYRPQVLWFDWWIEQPAFAPVLRTLAAYYYNRAAEWGREVVINHKWDAFAPGTAVYDIERGATARIEPVVWQCPAPPGAGSRGTTTRAFASSSPSSSTSCPSAGCCCSTSGRSRTARSRPRSSACSRASVGGSHCTARPSTARGRGWCRRRGRPRSPRARSSTRPLPRTRRRTCGSPCGTT